MIDGLIAVNAPEDVIESARARFEGSISEDCEVWPENWQSLELFVALGTQWNVSAMGHYLGINYPAVDAIMNILAVPKKQKPDLFSDLQIMERAALEYINRDKK